MKQVFYFNFLCNSSGEFGSTSGFSPSSFVAPSSASVAASSPFFVPLSVDLFDFADGLGVSSLGVLLDFYDLFDFWDFVSAFFYGLLDFGAASFFLAGVFPAVLFFAAGFPPIFINF